MMLHDIEARYSNHYEPKAPQPHDRVLCFSGTNLLMASDGSNVALPAVADLAYPASALTYLFSLDDTAFFLAAESLDAHAESTEATGAPGIDIGQATEDGTQSSTSFSYQPLRDFRWIRPRETRFAIETAWQLSRWYADSRFCGRCGTKTIPDQVERMMRCPQCGNMIYPRISPGVIVGIIDKDKLLLTRYAGRPFTSWALVAGFTEIGEPLEDTVRREVLEEVGLHVKNVTYFSNQPWMRSSSLLVGFFAEVDGDRQITVDRTELADAQWVPWDQVPHEPDDYSLTRAMMCAFYQHHNHPERLLRR